MIILFINGYSLSFFYVQVNRVVHDDLFNHLHYGSAERIWLFCSWPTS